jgi:hypothetical protein
MRRVQAFQSQSAARQARCRGQRASTRTSGRTRRRARRHAGALTARSCARSGSPVARTPRRPPRPARPVQQVEQRRLALALRLDQRRDAHGVQLYPAALPAAPADPCKSRRFWPHQVQRAKRARPPRRRSSSWPTSASWRAACARAVGACLQRAKKPALLATAFATTHAACASPNAVAAAAAQQPQPQARSRRSKSLGGGAAGWQARLATGSAAAAPEGHTANTAACWQPAGSLLAAWRAAAAAGAAAESPQQQPAALVLRCLNCRGRAGVRRAVAGRAAGRAAALLRGR